LPTLIQCIQLNHLVTYSISRTRERQRLDFIARLSLLDERTYDARMDVGHGLSLVTVQNLERLAREHDDVPDKSQPRPPIDLPEELDFARTTMPPADEQPGDETSTCPSSAEATEHDKQLFDRISENRTRLEMKHRELMIRAARFVGRFSANGE
jgi:hypothetical protein